MSAKSLPLSVQLLLAFLSLVVGATVVLTVSAYRSTFESLETDARRTVRTAAQTRHQLLTQTLLGHQLRSRGFLVAAESACSEPRPAGGLAWPLDCLRPMLRQFRATEGVRGALVTYRGRRIAAFGMTVAPAVIGAGALAAVVERPGGPPDYLMRTTHNELTLAVQFSGTEIDAIFADRAGLRSDGEVFLINGDGGFLTQARHWSSPSTRTPPGAATSEPLTACLEGPGERLGIDYRGVETIHAFQPVSALGRACIDAHVGYAEALAPAEQLKNALIWQGGVFVVLGVVLSLVAAQRIAAPVRRLAIAARQVQGAQFHLPIPIGGPSEVRELGHAFRAMATELVNLLEREKAARRDAEGANRTKDEFLARISHELRTPLTAILGWSRLLRTGRLAPDQRVRAVEAIERGAEVQRRLIEDLLDVSRIVTRRVQVVLAPTNIGSVVEKALDAVRPQAAEKRLRLETSLPDDLVVLGDPERLQQVVWNLASNAVKFTGNGGTIRVLLRNVGTSVELSVSDSGVGIPATFLPHVFDWFRQADAMARGSQSGLGLGLGIVKHLVHVHGGTVRAESPGEGQGATFTVTLPLHLGTAFSESALPADHLESVDPGPRLNSLRVLVVDDDDPTRDALRAVLEDAGATVLTASSAAEARHIVFASTPDLLISDIAMPEEDGYALLRSLRAANVNTPAIALTALARREDAEAARAAGYQMYLIKPANPVTLIEEVANLRG